MHTLNRKQNYPDLYSKPTAHHFGNTWDSLAAARIIQSNCRSNRIPAFLYLGRKEAALLRQHLAAAYGEDAVSTLHETYYMGLKVIEVDSEQYICTGGSKVFRGKLKTPRFQQAS